MDDSLEQGWDHEHEGSDSEDGEDVLHDGGQIVVPIPRNGESYIANGL